MDDAKETLSRLKWVLENLEKDSHAGTQKSAPTDNRDPSANVNNNRTTKETKKQESNIGAKPTKKSTHKPLTMYDIDKKIVILQDNIIRTKRLGNKKLHLRQIEKYKKELDELQYRRQLMTENVIKRAITQKSNDNVHNSTNEVIIDSFTDIKVSWADLEFKEDYVKVYIKRKKDTFSFACIGSRTTYNWIKEGFATRLDPIAIRLHSAKSPELLNAPYLNAVVKALSIREAFKIDPTQIRTVKRFLDTCKENVSALFLPSDQDRSKYFSFLCTKQSKEHKFIPVWEFGYSGQEEAFIFTLKSLSGYAVILENCSINRATYVCKSSEASLGMTTQRIFDYFSSEMKKKRTMARNGNAEELFGLNLHAIDHNDFTYWKIELNRYLR